MKAAHKHAQLCSYRHTQFRWTTDHDARLQSSVASVQRQPTRATVSVHTAATTCPGCCPRSTFGQSSYAATIAPNDMDGTRGSLLIFERRRIASWPSSRSPAISHSASFSQFLLKSLSSLSLSHDATVCFGLFGAFSSDILDRGRSCRTTRASPRTTFISSAAEYVEIRMHQFSTGNSSCSDSRCHPISRWLHTSAERRVLIVDQHNEMIQSTQSCIQHQCQCNVPVIPRLSHVVLSTGGMRR